MRVRSATPDLMATAGVSSPEPLAATVELRRQLKFGDSIVDEAAVLLVEMSVLIYEPLDKIRRAIEPLRFERHAAFGAVPTNRPSL